MATVVEVIVGVGLVTISLSAVSGAAMGVTLALVY